MIVQFEKKCPHCSAPKPLTDFPKNGAKIDGRADYCREHSSAASKKSKAKKRAEYAAAVAALSNSDRARLGLGPLAES